MKGLSEMLWLMVGAILVIVVAVVLLVIFANVIDDPIYEFKNQCEIRARTSCRTASSLPIDWNFQDATLKTSCQDQFGYTSCPAEWLE